MSESRSRPRAREDVHYQDVADGCVLYDPKGEKVFALNATAAFVWNCCDGGHAAEDVLEELTSALGSRAPVREQLRRDVESSLDDFRRNGLLVAE